MILSPLTSPAAGLAWSRLGGCGIGNPEATGVSPTFPRAGDRVDFLPGAGPWRCRGFLGEPNGFGGGEESAVVKGVKLVDL
jgi:hypothetical protein